MKLRDALKRLVRKAYWTLGGYENDPELDEWTTRAFIEGHVTGNPKFSDVAKARADEAERRKLS
jgi:hypothetical protein